MKLEAEIVDMETSVPIVVMNSDDADELGVNPLDRVILEKDGDKHTGVVDTTDHLVKKGELGLSSDMFHFEGVVDVSIAKKPDSLKSIKKKLEGKELTAKEIRNIINDINRNKLSDIELGSWVAGMYSVGMDMEESKHLVDAMIDVGDKIDWDYDIIGDKHSIGGVPGNRVTPILVPIVAATGLKIPKTSSRAITSPSGTADTMEVFCDVEFPINHIKEIVHQTGACMVWGGSVNLSPTDDKIIRAESPLSLDPESQVLASVLSKKKSAGSTHVVIDIPYGENSKVMDIDRAENLGEKFKKLGEEFDMNIDCALTRGDQPIGRGVGPNLEAIDILKVLRGEGPDDLRRKSIRLADILLDICGKEKNAEEMLDSGKAMNKFWSIVKAQRGEEITEKDIKLGEFTKDLRAHKEGHITTLDNRVISDIARRAGAPKDKAAGVYLHKKKGDRVEKNEKILTIYAEKEEKLDIASDVADEEDTFIIKEKGEIVMEEI